MKQGTILAVLLAAAVTSLTWAADPWKDTPSSEWTMENTTDILTNSPWVHDAHVPAPWITGEPQFLYPLLGGCGVRLDPNERRPQPYSGPSFQSVVVYRVAWVSAKAYREAKARRAVLCGEMEKDDAESFVEQNTSEDYLIFIQSPDMTPFDGVDKDAIAKNTTLTGKKSGVSISPTSVDVQGANGGRIFGVLFHFPKTTADGKPTVSPDEKEMTFSYKFGKTEIRAASSRTR